MPKETEHQQVHFTLGRIVYLVGAIIFAGIVGTLAVKSWMVGIEQKINAGSQGRYTSVHAELYHNNMVRSVNKAIQKVHPDLEIDWDSPMDTIIRLNQVNGSQ